MVPGLAGDALNTALLASLDSVTETESRSCQGCGGPIGKDNKHGYCHANVVCKKKAYNKAATVYRAKQPIERPGRGRPRNFHGKPYEAEMIRNARRRARLLGVECTLTVYDIVIPEVCPVLGIPLARGTQRQKNASPSIDRIRNDRGYTPDNIWVISLKANRMKNDATDAELLLFADWIHKHLGMGG